MTDALKFLPALESIWSDTLALERVDRTGNFFELGGDSFMVTTVMLHIEEKFGTILDPLELFNHPILQDFSARVQELVETGDRGA